MAFERPVLSDAKMQMSETWNTGMPFRSAGFLFVAHDHEVSFQSPQAAKTDDAPRIQVSNARNARGLVPDSVVCDG